VLGDAGVHVVQTPFQAPNANAYAEPFVRSITFECLVPLGAPLSKGTQGIHRSLPSRAESPRTRESAYRRERATAT
jgi:hypothetical protein